MSLSQHPGMQVEGEVAFRLARDLPASGRPYTAEQVADAVEGVCAALEICESRLADFLGASIPEKIADNLANGAFVHGAIAPVWRKLDLAKLHVTMTVNGTTLVDKVGGKPGDAPFVLLQWAANHLGSGEGLPTSGAVFLSVRDDDKREIVFMAKRLAELGFRLLATRGTARFLKLNGLECESVLKVGEGKPDVVDRIASGEVTLVINTPLGRRSQFDERAIRASALRQGVPIITTIAGALAAVSGIEALAKGRLDAFALQETP